MATLIQFRVGHATNSSSTHSVVLLRQGNTVTDREPDSEGCYGWEFFTAASKHARMTYVAAQLYQCLSRSMPDEAARLLCQQLAGVKPTSDDWGVDHQSAWTWPLGRGTNLPDFEFVRQVVEFMSKEGVAVLGGNDNEDTVHPNWEDVAKRVENIIPTDQEEHALCRQDGPVWTLFYPKHGNVVRFSFGDVPDDWRATRPELADLKITDMCHKKCAFCYAASTPGGQHSKEWFGAVKALGKMEVFEAAIGGGEPTEHPSFVDIIEQCADEGVIPNFSTATFAWLENERVVNAAKKHCGAVGYSIGDNAQGGAVKNAWVRFHDKGLADKLVIHAIPRVLYGSWFREILIMAHSLSVPVVLLGYKNTGRGKTNTWRPTPFDWVKVAAEVYGLGLCPQIGVDTTLAAETDLGNAGIPYCLYQQHEGVSSMFIDAVKQQIGPSSFCGKEQMVHVDLSNGLGRADDIADVLGMWFANSREK